MMIIRLIQYLTRKALDHETTGTAILGAAHVLLKAVI
jgi:hypothetical protein